MEANNQRLFLRWTLNERIQHWLLAGSFITLVISGFALRYPDTWWAIPMVVGDSIDLRSIVHRIAATINTGVAVYHVGYLLFTSRGRFQLKHLILKPEDFRHLRDKMLQNLGVKTKPIVFSHYTYWEKFEYWALIWGTIVMLVTGVSLWFENFALQYISLFYLDVGRVIHYYEAILASLSILVWHFYFVIANPETYPVNFSMFNGYLTQEEMEAEHDGELKDILEEEHNQSR
ncbi:MAG: hypothetical protein DWQ05_14680 [Calditrichaeota bacterium]|nr:MAG: hypothetical protein DWQ05_14680 [Calditrichota bacterium]